MPPTVTGALVTASVTNPWRRADRVPAAERVSFSQMVCPEPTATVEAAWSWSTLHAVTRSASVPQRRQEAVESVVASNTQGRSEASIRTVAPASGPRDPESVTKPWTRPSRPDAPAKADARMSAAIAKAPTANQLAARR